MNPVKFSRIAESLRQYRRAELKDFEDELGGKPVAALYVDPLPNDAVLTSVMSGNTTFLLGRKGTGKSTVFAKAQSLFRERSDLLSTYLDVKSLCDVLDLADIPANLLGDGEIDQGILRAHILRKGFIGRVISELLKEINNVCDSMSLWDTWRGKKRSFAELKGRLTGLQTRVSTVALQDQEVPILQKITRSWKRRQQHETGGASEGGLDAKLSSTGMKVGAHASASDFEKSLDDSEVYNEYSDVVLRSFPFHEIISEIQDLLTESGLKRLVVFFDDFSELNFVDQRLFVDVVLSPLNNASNEAVKLKVAGYPGRVYYGRIDATKVDTICLDFASIYETAEVQAMERSATDYAHRLLRKRFEAFGEDIADYFDAAVPIDQHMRLIFETTFNVPRLMGTLLHTCYLDRVSNSQPITAASLKLAAQKHYESTISQYFDRLNRFALEPFENKLDRHNQQELLKHIVKEARDVRLKINDGSIGGAYFKDVRNPPTSHFIVSPNLTDIFRSLEANFLLSKYKDTRDKNGKPVVVYALYYGLTESERLAWGYPPGRDFRNYFVQRCFDFTAAIHEFLSKNQTIRCGTCGACYPLDQKDSFELFKWRCPECRDGTCSVVNLSEDYVAEISKLRGDLMLEPIELEILNTLEEEKSALAAGEIAALIDETYQLVGRRTSKLKDMGLVDKDKDFDGKMKSRITDRAESVYFVDDENP